MQIQPVAEQTPDPRIKWLCEKIASFAEAYDKAEAAKADMKANQAQFAKELAARMQAA